MKKTSVFIVTIILLFLISVPAFCGVISEAVTKGSGDLNKVLNDIDNNVSNASNIIIPVIGFCACLIAGGYFMFGHPEGKKRVINWIFGFILAAGATTFVGGLWAMFHK
jgi:hypothetical protein